jgi:hypothetical protein
MADAHAGASALVTAPPLVSRAGDRGFVLMTADGWATDGQRATMAVRWLRWIEVSVLALRVSCTRLCTGPVRHK